MNLALTFVAFAVASAQLFPGFGDDNAPSSSDFWDQFGTDFPDDRTQTQVVTVTATSEPIITMPAYTTFVFETIPYMSYTKKRTTILPTPLNPPSDALTSWATDYFPPYIDTRSFPDFDPVSTVTATRFYPGTFYDTKTTTVVVTQSEARAGMPVQTVTETIKPLATRTETWWFPTTITNFVTKTKAVGASTTTVVRQTKTVTRSASYLTVPATAVPQLEPGMPGQSYPHMKSLNLIWGDTDNDEFEINIRTKPKDENDIGDNTDDNQWDVTWLATRSAKPSELPFPSDFDPGFNVPPAWWRTMSAQYPQPTSTDPGFWPPGWPDWNPQGPDDDYPPFDPGFDRTPLASATMFPPGYNGVPPSDGSGDFWPGILPPNFDPGFDRTPLVTPTYLPPGYNGDLPSDGSGDFWPGGFDPGFDRTPLATATFFPPGYN